MNVLQYLTSLQPALPLASERRGDKGEYLPMSGSELRRCLQQKAVLINGQTDWEGNEEIPDFIWQLVFYPKSKQKDGKKSKRTTII